MISGYSRSTSKPPENEKISVMQTPTPAHVPWRRPNPLHRSKESAILQRGCGPSLPPCPGCKNPPYSSAGNSKHLPPLQEIGPRYHPSRFLRPFPLLHQRPDRFLRRSRDDEGSLFLPARNPSRKSSSPRKHHRLHRALLFADPPAVCTKLRWDGLGRVPLLPYPDSLPWRAEAAR